MKYIFSFEEINFGSIVINSEHKPNRNEVIDCITNGDAYYLETEYGEIKLVESGRANSKSEGKYEG